MAKIEVCCRVGQLQYGVW